MKIHKQVFETRQFGQGVTSPPPWYKLSIMPAMEEYVPPIKHNTPMRIIVEQSTTCKHIATLI
jgi:hypothetical protein